MEAVVERRAPDTLYLVVPLCLAILAVIAELIGSAGDAVWIALLALFDFGIRQSCENLNMNNCCAASELGPPARLGRA